MDYNPCSQDPLLYATIYYKCTKSPYGTADPYQLIKFYGNRIPTTTSSTTAPISSTTSIPDISTTYKDHKNDDDDNDDNKHQIHNDIQSNKPCILNKRKQRTNLTPHRNRLSYDQDHIVQNPSIYQISVSNPGCSNPIGDRVDTCNESDYALPSYEEAVGNTYERVNYRAPKVSNV
ncbi:unnamed protein product [Mytilus coruscus]|uniref:Uncharacterized protein n=1 Tax=Mytilus coruscus TaxID=42192 RepID=A0A6J8AJ32_MYTCO|nr:unnamed protein product [Mytilus coruscus]